MAHLICPHCGSAEVGRSRRRSTIDFLFASLGIYPYRCAVCLHRFRQFGKRKDNPAGGESTES